MAKRRKPKQKPPTVRKKPPANSVYLEAIETLSAKEVNNEHFWDHFMMALDVEPRDHTVIEGRSGVQHRLLGIGVNEKQRRLVLVSDTPSAEHAALMQVDVAATADDLNVVVARPAAFDLTGPITSIIGAYGSNIIDKKAINRFNSFSNQKDKDEVNANFAELFGAFMLNSSRSFKFTPLTPYSQFLQFVNQISLIDFSSLKDIENASIDLLPFSKMDITKQDRDMGICPIPCMNLQRPRWRLFFRERTPMMLSTY